MIITPSDCYLGVKFLVIACGTLFCEKDIGILSEILMQISSVMGPLIGSRMQ